MTASSSLAARATLRICLRDNPRRSTASRDLKQSRTSLALSPTSVVSPSVHDEMVCFTLELEGSKRLELPLGLGELAEAVSAIEHSPDKRGRLMAPFTGAIKSAVRTPQPLWLVFDSPCGTLPGVAWEALLQPDLESPVLRQSYLAPTFETPSEIDIVIVLAPPRKDRGSAGFADFLAALLDQWGSCQATSLHFHVFTDPATSATFAAKDYSHRGGPHNARAVTVYSLDAYLAGVAGPNQSTQDAAAGVSWLDWVCKMFPTDRAVDLAYFFCQGHQSLDQGYFTLPRLVDLLPSASAAVDGPWISFDARRTNSFLTQLGAWSIGFESPATTASLTGLRLLADGLARLLPGPIFVVDRSLDPTASALDQLCHFLFDQGPAPRTAAITIYSWPAAISAVSSARSIEGTNLSHLEELRKALPRTSSSRWLAASQRFLETAIGEDDRLKSGGAGESSGSQAAYRFLTELVTKYASVSPAAWTGGLAATLDSYAQRIDETSERLAKELQEARLSPTGATIRGTTQALSRYAGELEAVSRLANNLLGQKDVAAEVDVDIRGTIGSVQQALEQIEKTRQELAHLAETSHRISGASAKPTELLRGGALDSIIKSDLAGAWQETFQKAFPALEPSSKQVVDVIRGWSTRLAQTDAGPPPPPEIGAAGPEGPDS